MRIRRTENSRAPYGLGEEHRRWESSPELLNPALEKAGVLLPDGMPLEAGAPRRTQRIAMSLGMIERHFGLSPPCGPVMAGQLPTVVVSGQADFSELW